MPKQKHDYEKLKKEFFASKHSEVKWFITDKWLRYNSEWAKRTKGRSKEKKELKVESSANSIKEAWKKLSKQLEPSTEFLLWNIAKAIELTKVKLDQMEQKWNINVKDLNTIRGMNRIQNWQPTTYVKEESDVNQNIRIEWIHIVMWWNPIDSSKSDENNV
jgi:hypothetical protein